MRGAPAAPPCFLLLDPPPLDPKVELPLMPWLELLSLLEPQLLLRFCSSAPEVVSSPLEAVLSVPSSELVVSVSVIVGVYVDPQLLSLSETLSPSPPERLLREPLKKLAVHARSSSSE